MPLVVTFCVFFFVTDERRYRQRSTSNLLSHETAEPVNGIASKIRNIAGDYLSKRYLTTTTTAAPTARTVGGRGP